MQLAFHCRLELQQKRLRCNSLAPVQGVENSVVDLRNLGFGMCISRMYAQRFLKHGELHVDVKISDRD